MGQRRWSSSRARRRRETAHVPALGSYPLGARHALGVSAATLVSVCVCVPGTDTPQYCPRHWPERTLEFIDRAATKARASVDRLAQDREAIATDAINVLGELLLPHVPAPYRVMFQKLWTQFAPVAVGWVTIRAASVTVVDERGPGAVVELVDERTPQTTTPRD